MKAVIILAIALLGMTICDHHFRGHQQEGGFITEQSLENQRDQASFEMYSYEEHPFKNWSESQIKSLLGLSRLSLKDTSKVLYDLEATSDLPESFDSREQWPDCIHPIRNQGHCGSCWAHAASEVLSDRFCIASKGQINVALSPQDLVSCDYFDHGCNGGILTTSWVYLRLFGIVSDTCKPYQSQDGKVPMCSFFTKQCSDKNETYRKYHAKNLYWLTSIDKIKKSLYENGPVETGFQVFDDFINYKSGIYKKSAGAKFLGGHAVKIIGWGKEQDTEYWIVANSWAEKWGEQGYFRIAFRECGIENCIAGDPQL